MCFDRDRLQDCDEAVVARDTAICFWLRRWKHGVFKGASFIRLTNPTADMLFVNCYEERRYAERLATYIGEFGDNDTVYSASLAQFFFPYPYDRL